jgi:hypothetical protein
LSSTEDKEINETASSASIASKDNNMTNTYFSSELDFDAAKFERLLQPDFIKKIASTIPDIMLETRDAEEMFVRFASSSMQEHELAEETPETAKELVTCLAEMGFNESFLQKKFLHIDESILIHPAIDWALRYLRVLLYKPHPADPLKMSDFQPDIVEVEPDMCSVPLRSGRTVMAVILVLKTVNDFLEAPQDFEKELSVLFRKQNTESVFDIVQLITSLMSSIPSKDNLIVEGHLRATEEACLNLFFLTHFVHRYLLRDDAEPSAALDGLGQMICQYIDNRH